MSAGMVVVGQDAKGANLSMIHGETALVSEAVEDTVDCFFRFEDSALRRRLLTAGHDSYPGISRIGSSPSSGVEFQMGILEALRSHLSATRLSRL